MEREELEGREDQAIVMGKAWMAIKIHDCLLSIRTVIMATHAWAKLGQMNGLSKL